MHKHDLDLIAEYAEGTLGDDSTARALVASCDTCAGEFRAHQAVLAELRGIEPARMTEHERAQLHRDLWTELRSPRSVRSDSASPGWRGWAIGAAAIVFVAIALLGVMNNLGGSEDTTATFSEVGAALDSGEEGVDEDADDGASAEESLTPAAESPRALEDSYATTPYFLIARQVREQASTEDTTTFTYDERTGLDCLEQSGLTDHELVGGFETITDLLVAIPAGTDLAEAPVAFIDPEFCTVVHIED